MVKSKKKEDQVSMHNLLREMTLKIVHPQFMVKAGMALEELPKEDEWTEDLLKVSLMNNNIREFPSSMLSPKCPMLTTLLLSKNNITTIPEAFFDHMPRLKILDLSGNRKLHRLPCSLSKLESLTTLLLKNCESLEEVPSLSNLGGLKKLTLYGTSIKELPQGLNMLTNLKYLWLGGMVSDIPDGLLRNLQNLVLLYLCGLEKLNATVGAVEAVAKLAPLPAGTFSSLQKIEVWRCGKIKKLLPLRLLRYLQNLQTIQVDHCDQMEEIIWSEYEEGEKALEKLTLPKLERVALEELPALKSIYSGSTIVLICDSLKRIEITMCQEIESVFWTGLNPLPTLEHLELCYLKNLKSVFDEEVLGLSAHPTNFFSLKTIRVVECPRLKKVFSSRWLLGYFQSLETIEVEDCSQMEELISSSTYEEKEALEKFTLPKLQKLKLSRLPELKSTC
ncbi:hypothetical protein SLE2022_395580 [Rubroshorea leprosula]